MAGISEQTLGIAINIGNSRVQCARILATGIVADTLKTYATKDFAAALDTGADEIFAPAADLKLVTASVVPEVTARLVNRFAAAVCRFVTPETVGARLDVSGVDASTVGADRLANGVAVAGGEQPTIVVDCGTAITVEAVDAGTRFYSLAILPGRALCRRALHCSTGQLPEVDIAPDLPPVPANNTVEAIRNGCDRGLVGAVVSLVDSAMSIPQLRGAKLVLTGGDAMFFDAHLFLEHDVDPLLTLKGAAMLA